MESGGRGLGTVRALPGSMETTRIDPHHANLLAQIAKMIGWERIRRYCDE